MNVPDKCVVDTNVPIIANHIIGAVRSDDIPDQCILACIEAIESVIQKKALVIDIENEIFDEYKSNLSMSGQPGYGDAFMKWVHYTGPSLPASQRVAITKIGDSYKEFPDHPELTNFDLSDRKFVAVANAHPKKPPILEAADSKWWGWKQPLEEVGITVWFLCPEYIENKYSKKIGP
jgi:hypothetical protein